MNTTIPNKELKHNIIFKVLFYAPLHVLTTVWNLERKKVILFVIVSLILSLKTYSTVIITKIIIESINNQLIKQSIILVVSFLFVQIIFLTMETLNSRINFILQEEFSKTSQFNLLKTLSNKELIELENPRFKGMWGGITYSITKYYESYSNLLHIIQILISLILNISFLFSIHIFAAIVIGIFFFLKIIVIRNIQERQIKITKIINKNQRLQDYFYHLLSSPEYQKEIRVNKIDSFLKTKWVGYRNENTALYYNINKLNSLGGIVLGSFNLLSTAIISIIILYLIYGNKVGIAVYVSATVSITAIEGLLTSLITSVSKQFEYRKFIDTYEDWSIKDTITGEEKKKGLSFEDEIIVHNLSYKYPNSNCYSIENVNLRIKKGEIVAILGENGAGKSTLIKLLLGLYQAPPNTILYDGICQTKLDRSTIWAKTSVVFQDFIKYMLTIKENLTLNQIEVDDASLNEAIKEFGLNHLLELSNGYQTQLGYLNDEAINLSGGEWQKLALTRSFLLNKEIMILDEPTASLDPEAELNLFEKIILNREENKKTILVVTHRIAIAKKADKVIYMEKGKIVESGLHSDLIKNNDRYREIWEKQKEFYQ